MKYKELVPQWWSIHKLRARLKQTTIHRSEEIIKVHLLPYWGEDELNEITVDKVMAFRDYKKAHGSPIRHPGELAATTVNKLLQLLRASLQYAYDNGWMQTNPAAYVYCPPDPPKDIAVFTPEDIRRLIEYARPLWMGDLINLAYRTGMRRGELFGLKWIDINWADKSLKIYRSVCATVPKETMIQTTKTKRSCRYIKLDDKSIEVLKKRQAKAKSEWVFEDKDGKLLSPWVVTKYMREACKRANVTPNKFHALRHTHATTLIDANTNLRVVQERLGHASLNTTLEIYYHVLPSAQAAAADVFNHI